MFDNCLDYTGTSASLKLETAQCNICADGFGLDSQSHTCHQCDPEGVDNWDLCTDCSFDITGVKNDCTACVVTDTPANDKTLTVSEGEYPFHQCKFPEIENCDQAEEGGCAICAPGHWFDRYNWRCATCGIDRCNKCEPVTNDEWLDGVSVPTEYPTCSRCDNEFKLV